MKVLKTFVSLADLSVYHPGDEYPKAGATPAPETVRQLIADGMIAAAPEKAAEEKPKRTRKGG